MRTFSLLYHCAHGCTITKKTIFHFPIYTPSEIQKGICHTWSRGRDFSPSMPVREASIRKRSNAQAKSDLRAQISMSIVEVPRSDNTSRGTVSRSTDFFFSTDACALGSSPHCAQVYCSLSHAFTFENVCCLAKEMTSPQYKCLLSLPLLLNFVFTVVAFNLSNYSLRRNGTRFREWLPLSGFLVMRIRTFHLLVDTIRSELEVPVITPQLTIKMAAQAKHKLFQNIFSTRFF